MKNNSYMKEGLDLKRLLLLYFNKLWLAIAAALLGAAAGAGLYLMVHLVFAPEGQYQSVSKIYLHFDTDPQDMNQLSYNGYTWNDLMITDPILDYTMRQLPEEITRETVISATRADILSDIRLLTITITSEAPETVALIMKATQDSLIHLGETDELFHSIEIYSTQEPSLIIWTNRSLAAALTGMCVALFAFLVLAAVYYVLDDSLYVHADVKKRYGIPAVGTLVKGKGSIIPLLEEDCAYSLLRMYGADKGAVLLHPEGQQAADETATILKELVRKVTGKDAWSIRPVGIDHLTPEILEELRRAEGILVSIAYGSKNGKKTELLLDTLEKQDSSVTGILIVDADAKFLARYYTGKNKVRKCQ